MARRRGRARSPPRRRPRTRKNPSGVRSPVRNSRVALVDVARHELRGVGIGARDQQRRHAGDVGRQPCGEQRPDELAGRDEHLAAEVAALLLGRELVLVVHRRRAGFDHPAHQLERVERPAEAGLRVGDDREEVVDAVDPLGPLDLVGAEQCVVQPPHHRRHAVRGVEALVGIDLGREVAVGRDLPAGEVDRLQPGLRHLHGLAAGERAERVHVVLLREQPPELLGADPGEAVLDANRAAQADDVLGGVVALDPAPAGRFPGAAEIDGFLGGDGVHGCFLPGGGGDLLHSSLARRHSANRTSRSDP